MNLEDQILCLLTRQSFTAQHSRQLRALAESQVIDWQSIFETAELHHITPLVYHNLSELSSPELEIPRATLSKLKKAYIHNVFVKRGTAKIMAQVLGLFARKGIDVMVVKGEALNMLVYDQPWYTVSYDVDLVIRAKPHELEPADRADIEKMMETFNRTQNEFKEHIEYDYFEHHDVTMNNVLAVDFKQLWAEAKKTEIYGHNVFVLQPEDMLIAAAVNSCRKRFFRLKTMCDIAAIIERFPNLDWAKLADKAKAYHCRGILYAALTVTQMTVGCNLPADFLDSLKVNPVRVFAIRWLVNKLSRSYSLAELATRSESTAFGREFSWSLMLTYAAYHKRLLAPKLAEIFRAWRNPPPPVPTAQ